MKVLVIGATGHTGKLAVDALLERGDEVTAFVRDPAAFPTSHDRLHTAQGDARNAESLERAIEGKDAVLSALGPRSMKKGDLQEVFMRNLVGAMKKTGTKRLANLSAWGAGDSYEHMPFVGKMFVRAVLSELFADKERGEVILFASGLDYVNARPGLLSNGPAHGGVKASLDPNGVGWWPLFSRADLADFMVRSLSDETWVRASPLLGY